MHRITSIVACLAVAACGSSSVDGPHLAPRDAAGLACTGPVPSNATPCPGSDGAPASDTSRYVTPACSRQPCSYACVAGYMIAGGACVTGIPPPRRSAVLRDAGDGTLVDEVTGARWLKDAGCGETVGGHPRPDGLAAFLESREWLSGLATGSCGLSDGSRPGDWHMPSEAELLALVGASSLFGGAPAGPAWSSMEPCSTTAITVDPTTGDVGEHLKGDLLVTWPIRRP